MTDQSDILSGEQVATTQPAPTVAPQVTPAATPSVDAFGQQLSAIKNEDGLQKYANVSDALTGAGHAQEFIKTLKAEATARDEEVHQLQNELANAQSQIASTQTVQPTAASGLSREDVHSAMQDYEQSKSRQSNRKSVIDTLVNHCNGDQVKASEMINERLAAVGMTRDQLGALSESSPQAVYELLKINGMGSNSTAPATSGTIRTDAVEMSNQGSQIPKAKAPPIGASSSHLIDEWRAAGQVVQNNLGN